MSNEYTQQDAAQVTKMEHDVALNAKRVTSIGQIINSDWDYLAATYPNDTTEVYTYKLGGSGGTVVNVVTVVYTDSSKEAISSLTKV